MNRDESPRYMASTACAVANLKPPTLRAWRNLGWFRQETEKSPGQWTLYSYLDLCVLRCATVLIEQGVSGNIAVPIAEKLRPSFGTDDDGFGVCVMAAVFYPAHTEKGGIPADMIRVRNVTKDDCVLDFWPGGGDDCRAFIMVDIVSITTDVLQSLKDLGDPSISTAEETHRMMLEAAAQAIRPKADGNK